MHSVALLLFFFFFFYLLLFINASQIQFSVEEESVDPVAMGKVFYALELLLGRLPSSW